MASFPLKNAHFSYSPPLNQKFENVSFAQRPPIFTRTASTRSKLLVQKVFP